MFKPGQSGNPSGRKPGNKTIRELAKVHSEAALKTLAEIANNPEASDNSRVAACNALLDRASSIYRERKFRCVLHRLFIHIS